MASDNKSRHLLHLTLLLLSALISTTVFVHHTSAAKDPVKSQKQVFSLRLRDTDISNALRLLGEEFSLNIVLGDDVSGKITVNFEKVTLEEALNSILKSKGLGYVLEGKIIRVETQEKLDREKSKKDERELKRLEVQEASEKFEEGKKYKELQKAIREAEQQQKLNELQRKSKEAQQQKAEAEKKLKPLVTKTVKLKYITSSTVTKDGGKTKESALGEFQAVLEKMLSGKENSGITLLGKTNTLVVTDIQEHVDKIIKMVKELDVPIPQIRIEARIVEVKDRDQLSMGIQWGGKYTGSIQGKDAMITQGGNVAGFPLGADVDRKSWAVNLPANVADTVAGQGIGGVLGFTLGSLGSRYLDVQLSALEKADKINIISYPSILVMQNQSAEIHVGSEVPVITGFEADTGEAKVEYKKIGVKLGIIPQITSEDSIFMTINIEKSARGEIWILRGQSYSTIDTKNAFTQVVVKNNETVVIGGLYTKKTTKVSSGVPYLSKIPLLGCLFSYKSDDTQDEELLIFITPEIMPPAAEAGAIEDRHKTKTVEIDRK